MGWDPGGYYPSSEVHSPLSHFLHCPVFFWMKTQASSSKCPLTGLLSWTRAWNQKSWEQPKTILSNNLNAAVLQFRSQNQSSKVNPELFWNTDRVVKYCKWWLIEDYWITLVQIRKNLSVAYFQSSAYHLYITDQFFNCGWRFD